MCWLIVSGRSLGDLRLINEHRSHHGRIVKPPEVIAARIRKEGGEPMILCAGCGFQRV